MKDSVIICILAVALAGSALTNIGLARQSQKWQDRLITTVETLGEVREENRVLRQNAEGEKAKTKSLEVQAYKAFK